MFFLFVQRFIRGSGLAYGAYMALDVEAGHLSFHVYKVRTFSHIEMVEAHPVHLKGPRQLPCIRGGSQSNRGFGRRVCESTSCLWWIVGLGLNSAVLPLDST